MKNIFLFICILLSNNLFSLEVEITKVINKENRFEVYISLNSIDDIFIHEYDINKINEKIEGPFQNYYRNYICLYNANNKMIIFGGNQSPLAKKYTLNKYGLRPGKYIKFRGNKELVLIFDKSKIYNYSNKIDYTLDNYNEIIIEIEYFNFDMGHLFTHNGYIDTKSNTIIDFTDNVRWIEAIYYK